MQTNPVGWDGRWQKVCIPLVYNNAVETDTGWDLPLYGEIDPLSMRVFVQTVDAGITLEVGLLSTEGGGDADGFLDAVSVATAGWVRPRLTFTDATANYISAVTYGDFFSCAATGGFKGLAGANGTGTVGQPWVESHIGDGTAESLCYTCLTGADTFRGFLTFRWRQWPDLTNYLT
jgi:hypothetical protein